jgi:DNA-binding NtrC family response regulator
VVMGSSGVIQPADLPQALRDAPEAPCRAEPGYAGAVRQFKKQLILDALQQAQGSFTEAAKILNVHPNYLHRLVTTLDLREGARRPVASRPPTEIPRRFICV